jgi:hypothetical protein
MARLFDKRQRRLARLGMLSAAAAALLAPATSSAALLDNTLTFPQLSFDNQGTTIYDATIDRFTVNASPIAIRLVAGGVPILITPTGSGETFDINVTVDDSGVLVSGVPGDDLVVTGSVNLGGLGAFSGTLLTGEVTAFGFQDSGGTTDFFDFTFSLTGGDLAFLYSPTLAVSLTSEQSSFTGDFSVDFAGEAKGTLGSTPIPVPAVVPGHGHGGQASK